MGSATCWRTTSGRCARLHSLGPVRPRLCLLRRALVFQLLQCEFIKDVFSGMYMPLCVDSMNGFGMVTAANGLGGFVMIVMIPFSVIATKRYKKDNVEGNAVVDTGDTQQQGGYVGA